MTKVFGKRILVPLGLSLLLALSLLAVPRIHRLRRKRTRRTKSPACSAGF